MSSTTEMGTPNNYINDFNNLSTVDLLKELFKAQKDRAVVYSQFNEGFKVFLQTRHAARYLALMTESTRSFAECSQRVNAVEEVTKQRQREDIAKPIRTLQEHEREKLRLELIRQTLRREYNFRRFAWKRDVETLDGGGEAGITLAGFVSAQGLSPSHPSAPTTSIPEEQSDEEDNQEEESESVEGSCPSSSVDPNSSATLPSEEDPRAVANGWTMSLNGSSGVRTTGEEANTASLPSRSPSNSTRPSQQQAIPAEMAIPLLMNRPPCECCIGTASKSRRRRMTQRLSQKIAAPAKTGDLSATSLRDSTATATTADCDVVGTTSESDFLLDGDNDDVLGDTDGKEWLTECRLKGVVTDAVSNAGGDSKGSLKKAEGTSLTGEAFGKEGGDAEGGEVYGAVGGAGVRVDGEGGALDDEGVSAAETTCSEAAEIPEPTEEELRNALSEAIQMSADTISEINEIMEELRYLMTEEQENEEEGGKEEGGGDEETV